MARLTRPRNASSGSASRSIRKRSASSTRVGAVTTTFRARDQEVHSADRRALPGRGGEPSLFQAAAMEGYELRAADLCGHLHCTEGDGNLHWQVHSRRHRIADVRCQPYPPDMARI